MQHIQSHTADVIAVTAITVQEQLDGWHRVLNRARTRQEIARAYDRLSTAIVPSLQTFQVLPFPEPAILRFEQLLTLKLNIGRMDQRIAAIALEAGAIVVTRNRRDFGRIPGLVLEDWSV